MWAHDCVPVVSSSQCCGADAGAFLFDLCVLCIWVWTDVRMLACLMVTWIIAGGAARGGRDGPRQSGRGGKGISNSGSTAGAPHRAVLVGGTPRVLVFLAAMRHPRR
jgi:hypothetical protein